MSEKIYVLTNVSMHGQVKIGCTNRAIEQRLKELYRTSLPTEFDCFYYAEVPNAKEVEKSLHKIFRHKRTDGKREFFKVSPDQVVEAIKLAERKENYICEKCKNKNIPKNSTVESKVRTSKKKITFKELGIPVNSILHFSKDNNITCTTKDDIDQIIFEGRATSLSASALIIIRRMGKPWRTISGPFHWKYKGETLTKRRLRLKL